MPKLLLIDTNLLVLAIVSAVDSSQIERIGRTRAYTAIDAVLLDQVVSEHDSVLVTPHILTEASNLLGKIEDPLRSQIRSQLAALVPHWTERGDPSVEVVNDPFFRRFGMTDAAIARASKADVTVLTDDLPLFDALGRQGHRVINFTHVRSDSWREILS